MNGSTFGSNGEAFNESGAIVSGAESGKWNNWAYGAGGSYGGWGGNGSSNGPPPAQANSPYGVLENPQHLGSGGGAWVNAYPGGNGGGRVTITAGAFTNNGIIRANGIGHGDIPIASAGGSGGGILMNVGSFSGTGIIESNGGKAYDEGGGNGGGGGSGGRIAVYYNSISFPQDNIKANGRSGYNSGAAGTIYLKDNAQTNGDLIVDNNSISSDRDTPLSTELTILKRIDIKNLGRLSLQSNYSFIGQNIALNNGTLISNDQFQLLSGILSGNGTVQGNLINGAQIAPGLSPGTLTINGNYTQLPSGVFNIEIGGYTAETDYDQVIINGDAVIDGELNVSLINNFEPIFGDEFDIIKFNSGTGHFSEVNGWEAYGVTYGTDKITLVKATLPDSPITTAPKMIVSVPYPKSVTVPITVTNFNDVGAVSLKLQYNPAILTFSGFAEAALPDIQAMIPYAGLVTISWIGSPSLPGIYLPDESILLNLTFTMNNAGTSLLTWIDDDQGMGCEYMNATTQEPYEDLPYSEFYINGYVSGLAISLAVTNPCCPSLNNGSIDATVTGGSGSYTYAWSNGPDTEDISGLTQGTYTLTITDGLGATVSASATLVNPSAPPAEVGGPVPVTSNVECESSAVPPTLPVVKDACGNVLSPSAPVIGGTFSTSNCEGTITYTYTYTDCMNLTFVWTYTYTVDDITPPTITCPSDVIAYTNSGCSATGVVLGTPIINDNCGTPIVENNHPSTTYPQGITIVTWTVTDCSGLTATCDQSVTVSGANASGTFNYYNTAQTKLNNIEIELHQGGIKVYPVSGEVITDNFGYYSFSNVCCGTYDVVIVTDNATGGINSTDAAQVNYWAVNHSNIETVRFLAGDVNGDHSVLSGDAGHIQQYFITQGNPNPAFNSDWSFWKTGELINSNPGPSGYPTITVPAGAASVSQNFYGLVTGDFNRSYVPGSFKSGSENLVLTYGDLIEAGLGSEFELPLYAAGDMEVGAVSLILEFPSDLMEINGVFLSNDPDNSVPYLVYGDEIRIGWNSLTPLLLKEGEPMITILLKVNEPSGEEGIKFKLAADPLNELADGSFEVISDAVLRVDIIKTTATGLEETTLNDRLILSNRPNPFKETTTFDYSLPVDGKVTLEIYDIVGNKVKILVNETQSAGDYQLKMEQNELQPGVYTVTIRVENSENLLKQTIKIIKKNN
jgi:hypothetical protein